ncbi:DUF1906 domain-containing protein [Nocardia macrotermitis]|uniref:Putative peptidoglycan hydrolase n=1 Tax=Nocardia macrotermitis TaxID=2585198 RepID=A0A7K0D4S9_9NOCA|nr:DUF1906 domain-containing protein [Nocardia macrotermitis]MQY19834.1 putative peptidoglycan hydrolase [Nocardia macrotermitis]
MRSVPISRRTLFGFAAGTAIGATTLAAPTATAERPKLGTLVDYSVGVPSAAAIRSAGHTGAIRYVSQRRPGAEWMAAKPLQAREVEALHAAGLTVVSNYQYGKGPTADWRGGREAGKQCADRGLQLHKVAGGPDSAPIYASIDDNPTPIEFAQLIAPYLTGWQSVVGNNRLGVYANAPTISLARTAGLGAYFWQHDWGTPRGFVHPAANLHQFQINKSTLDGISVDLNTILTANYGQW